MIKTNIIIESIIICSILSYVIMIISIIITSQFSYQLAIHNYHYHFREGFKNLFTESVHKGGIPPLFTELILVLNKFMEASPLYGQKSEIVSPQTAKYTVFKPLFYGFLRVPPAPL